MLDEAGQVIGINVSKRMDGELLSFLVPAEFAQALLARAAKDAAMTRDAESIINAVVHCREEATAESCLLSPTESPLRMSCSKMLALALSSLVSARTSIQKAKPAAITVPRIVTNTAGSKTYLKTYLRIISASFNGMSS